MLYDPKWESQTKADPFSLATLIAWLEKQPAAKNYAYVCNGECLLAQYFTEQGFENVLMGVDDFDYGPDFQENALLPKHFDAIAYDNGRRGRNHTFGAALDRARAIAAA